MSARDLVHRKSTHRVSWTHAIFPLRDPIFGNPRFLRHMDDLSRFMRKLILGSVRSRVVSYGNRTSSLCRTEIRDAISHDQIKEPSTTFPIEITSTCEPLQHLRMQYHERHRYVPRTGPLTFRNQKKGSADWSCAGVCLTKSLAPNISRSSS